MDVRAEITAEAEAYRRADAEREERRLRLAELFKQARAKDIGPAEIERLTGHLYTKEHISRITTGKTAAKLAESTAKSPANPPEDPDDPLVGLFG